MNIAKLERMIAVYDAGSFRKAAKQFGMSQPALTWSIRQLEESLNISLFVRGPRGIKPTEACERLIVRARLIISEQQRLLAEVERSSRVQAIEIGVHPVMLHGDFSRTIARFRETDGDVALRLVEGYSTELHERLKQGELDLACCAAPMVDAGDDEFEFEPLIRQFYSVFARPDHQVFKEIESGATPSSHDWVQVAVSNLPANAKGSEDFISQLENIGMNMAHPAVRSTSLALIQSLILNAGLLGLLPDDLAANELASGALRRVPNTRVEGPPIGILSIRGSYKSASVRRIMSLLRQSHRCDRSLASV